MLDVGEVDRIVAGSLTDALAGSVVDVHTSPTIDSEGADALQVTVVTRDWYADRIDGNQVVDAIVRIQASLERSGEQRFPIVHFATESELAELELLDDDDPEA